MLAVPPDVARTLVPDLAAPNEFRAIVNAHFAVDPPLGFEPVTGLLNGTAHWLFAFDGRLSVTISDAERAARHAARRTRAHALGAKWPSVTGNAGRAAAGLADRRGKTRDVRGRCRARKALRPGTRTRWPNLMLAGDWTATGLPATIEGAIRSGQKAADLLMNQSMERR